MVSELIGKYIWLLQTLSAAGTYGLTFAEISRKYERRFCQAYPRRTFSNHREVIEELFGVPIECDRSTNCYYIPAGESAMDNDESVSWLVNTFTVGNLLTMGKERLSGRVAVDEVPSGQKHLTAIMQAMDDGRELEIVYSKYLNDSQLLHIQPLAVKEHERRWYLIAFCHERALEKDDNSDRDAWRVYSLDRISSLKETEATFKMPKGFDVDDLFSASYGIYFPRKDQKVVTIKFRTTEKEANYLRDLPLHHSQTEDGPTEDGHGRLFRIKAIPNENLTMELCKHAGSLEVLEPEDLRKAVAARLRSAIEQYDK